MRYRIQVTIDGELLGPIIGMVFERTKGRYDPDPKIYPVAETLVAPPRSASLPSDPRPKVKRHVGPRTAAGAKRQEIVEATLKTGPKRWSELRAAIGDAGLPYGTLNSLISKWHGEGKIRRSPDGFWSLVEQHDQAQATA